MSTKIMSNLKKFLNKVLIGFIILLLVCIAIVIAFEINAANNLANNPTMFENIPMRDAFTSSWEVFLNNAYHLVMKILNLVNMLLNSIL